MKRLAGLFLSLALLLSACVSPTRGGALSQSAPSADQVARAVLSACGVEAGEMQTLADQTGGSPPENYLTALYHLPDGSWEDYAVYLSSPAQAFEVAVFRLTPQADPDAVAAGLEAYRQGRQDTFTGYDPEQAALAANGLVLRSAGGDYAALLICPDPGAAREAFYAALEQGAPASTPAPSATADPAAGRTPYVDPERDDMTLYDTTSILTAWESGDTSPLSPYDRAIYTRAAQVLDAEVTGDMDDLERERAIYAWLTSHVAYDQTHNSLFSVTPRESYTPYNPLVEGIGVCLGFASTFQLLLDMAGVECITVVGASSGSRRDHAWNMVRLDGAWYCVDATWDVGRDETLWSYFNVTSDYMAATDHQWDYASVPEATAQFYDSAASSP